MLACVDELRCHRHVVQSICCLCSQARLGCVARIRPCLPACLQVMITAGATTDHPRSTWALCRACHVREGCTCAFDAFHKAHVMSTAEQGMQWVLYLPTWALSHDVQQPLPCCWRCDVGPWFVWSCHAWPLLWTFDALWTFNLAFLIEGLVCCMVAKKPGRPEGSTNYYRRELCLCRLLHAGLQYLSAH